MGCAARHTRDWHEGNQRETRNRVLRARLAAGPRPRRRRGRHRRGGAARAEASVRADAGEGARRLWRAQAGPVSALLHRGTECFVQSQMHLLSYPGNESQGKHEMAAFCQTHGGVQKTFGIWNKLIPALRTVSVARFCSWI